MDESTRNGKTKAEVSEKRPYEVGGNLPCTTGRAVCNLVCVLDGSFFFKIVETYKKNLWARSIVSFVGDLYGGNGRSAEKGIRLKQVPLAQCTIHIQFKFATKSKGPNYGMRGGAE